MTRSMMRWALAGCMAPAALGSAAFVDVGASTVGAAPSATSVSALSDAVGDANFNAPAFQDIVRGRLKSTECGIFELSMELAGPVPAAPPLPPPGIREIWWWWFFDLDPSAEPKGFPFPPLAQGPDFLVSVGWDGVAFAARAIDRRPLFAGGEAISTPVSCSVHGAFVEAVLPAALVGDFPRSFAWDPRTLNWSSAVGGGGFHRVDGASFATFTR